MVAQDELVQRIEAEARERQIEAGKLYGECHPKEELSQKIGEHIVDESTDETVEWYDQPEPQPEPVLTPTKPKSHATESDAILAKTAGTNRQVSFLEYNSFYTRYLMYSDRSTLWFLFGWFIKISATKHIITH